MRVLVLNAGSSTLKASILDSPAHEALVDRTVEWRPEASLGEREAAVRDVLEAATVAGIPAGSIEAVGHRVVHGGTRFTEPVRADEAVADAIDGLTELAPLHNPVAAATLRAALRALPDVPHVAAFDTAFHASLDEAAFRYPVPEAWFRERGVRRFGFHGLSVEWSVARAGELLERPVAELRLVVAHLGSGCSVTAVDGGRSVGTSMGMTPLEGLMMGTRAGSIDPGIVFRLLREGLPADDVEDGLVERSGLLAIGGTQDVRELLTREVNGDGAAALALEMFVRRAAAAIAAAATALVALDAVVFTAGIGEHAAAVRTRICERLGALGVPLPGEAPAGGAADAVLARLPERPAVLRVHAREDVVIAAATTRVASRA
jgi:acetate kinase